MNLKKFKIFDFYSNNLEIIRKSLTIDDNEINIGVINENGEQEIIKNIYVCPLSLKIFIEDSLKSEYGSPLSIEHVPPKSLGGKPIILTSKMENNNAGKTLDINLLNFVKNRNNFSIKCYFDNSSLRGNIKLENILTLEIDENNNEIAIQKFIEVLKNKETFKVEGKLNSIENIKISLIRIAYLMAFSHMGYAFIFGMNNIINPNINIIREIIKGDEDFLKYNIPILTDDFPDEFMGVNIIYDKEIKSIFVVFNLKLDDNNQRCGVVLPGPDYFGFDALNNFKKIMERDKKIDFKFKHFNKIEKLEDSLNYWTEWVDLNVTDNK